MAADHAKAAAGGDENRKPPYAGFRWSHVPLQTATLTSAVLRLYATADGVIAAEVQQ